LFIGTQLIGHSENAKWLQHLRSIAGLQTHAELLEPYSTRQAAAADYVRSVRPGLEVHTGELHDAKVRLSRVAGRRSDSWSQCLCPAALGNLDLVGLVDPLWTVAFCIRPTTFNLDVHTVAGASVHCSVHDEGSAYMLAVLQGMAAEVEAIQALVVSEETAAGLGPINEDRKERGFPPLEVRLPGCACGQPVQPTVPLCCCVHHLHPASCWCNWRLLAVVCCDASPASSSSHCALQAVTVSLVGASGGTAAKLSSTELREAEAKRRAASATKGATQEW
jgi:hypothetical protein